MRIFTKERSWRNFWIVVAVQVACIALVAVIKPALVWYLVAVAALQIVIMLFDSYLAGQRSDKDHN